MKYEVVGPWTHPVISEYLYYAVRNVKTKEEYCRVLYVSFEEDGENTKRTATREKAVNIAKLLTAAEDKK